MEGSPYQKFSSSQRIGVVPGTGPEVLPSGDPRSLLAGTQSIKAYDGTSDPDDHVAQYRQRMLTVALPNPDRTRLAMVHQPTLQVHILLRCPQ
ncbi:hypothetical protein F2Q69_00059533 [Brassica cretica]|uniref:Uncharacterized protein n=1 Tax=Brassica cretica TaxID=69181 RepID=A0A8S9RP53_BRACR|nr:hypothetical protein F2Q69_00059533 [Brassica cretica]